MIEIIFWCDGGIKGGNPGGVLVWGFHGEHRVLNSVEYFEGTGAAINGTKYQRTNNVAEWLGMYTALMHSVAQYPDCRKITVIGDSQLVIRQLSGEYKVRLNFLSKIYHNVMSLIKEHDIQLTPIHVLRGQNQKADGLANLAWNQYVDNRSLPLFDLDKV